MELLAFTHSAALYEDSTPVPQLRSFPQISPLGSNSALTGAIAATVVATTLCLSPDMASAALTPGDTGGGVEILQSALKAAGYYTGQTTGFYGAMTETAVFQFQSDRGLATDGIAGAETLNALALGDLGPGNVGGGGGGTPDSGIAVPSGPSGQLSRRGVVQTRDGVGINVRSSPYGTIVDGQPDGAVVPYSPNSATFRGGYTWVQTTLQNWVAQDYLKSSSGSTTPPDSSESSGRGVFRVATALDPLNVRATPRLSGASVGLLSPDSVHDYSSTVTGERVGGSDRWLYLPDYQGYVSAAYVDLL